ncbi:hypothetical protein SAMN04487911_1326 [Arenibacter nanhaiticus]|uniref:Uncharacterized protein n=1 Tax=Arenibacter nanhaiticus TaxID=558155 RepID=A0A1M6LJS6_9FLAO|nr:hypothetical protein [Arenibacter nanhaiticus]SHJ71441.1 hypothetical protein SAMN04487911_1326 [Arenibacter nanhaiticus]
MNTSLLLISGILVLCTFLPFLLFNKAGKSDIKLMSKQFKQMAEKGNLKLDVKENWGNSMIGIDKVQNKLVFSKIKDGEPFTQMISINEIDKCEIITKTKLVRTNSKRESVLEKLHLELSFIAQDKNNLVLGFYDNQDIYGEDFELKRAQKWSELITAGLDLNTARKAVA